MRVAARLYLHIGTQKSGTTYLQRVLQSLAPRLRDAGVLYPTWTMRGDLVYNHEPATYGLLGPAEYPWVAERTAETQRKPWARLVDQVRTWRGAAIVSGEAISVIRPDAARALVSALGVDDTVIIITARDLGRVLPSSWQQSIRNGRSASFTTYLASYARQRGPAGLAAEPHRWDSDVEHTFWRAYAIGTLAARWAAIVGPERVRVVGVPRSAAGPHALWHRFSDAVDLTGRIDRDPPEISELRANIGLTEPEILVLAAFNRAAEQRGISRLESRQARMHMIKDHLIARADRGRPVRLPSDWFDRVDAWAREDVSILEQSACTLIGDPADLIPAAAETSSSEAPMDEVLQAAAAALAGSVWTTPRGEGVR